MSATLSRVRYPTIEHGAVFFEDLLARARTTPGAVSVALSDSPPPLASGLRLTNFEVEGRQLVPDTQPTFRIRWVTPHYFETFRIPVVRGRTFQEIDATGEPAVALNESAERALFAGERAVGRRIRIPRGLYQSYSFLRPAGSQSRRPGTPSWE